jgi:DNA-binding NtrC family response regulator
VPFETEKTSESSSAIPSKTEATTFSLKKVGKTAARKAESGLIKRVLQETHWNRKETAKILGISYKALLYKIKECECNQGA